MLRREWINQVIEESEIVRGWVFKEACEDFECVPDPSAPGPSTASVVVVLVMLSVATLSHMAF